MHARLRLWWIPLLLVVGCGEDEAGSGSGEGDGDANGDVPLFDMEGDSAEDAVGDQGTADTTSDLVSDDADVAEDSVSDAAEVGEDTTTDGAEDALDMLEESGDDVADVAADLPPDVTDEPDAPPPVCTPGVDCESLDDELVCLTDEVHECERSTQCAVRFNSACPGGTGDCLTFYNAADPDMEALNAAEQAYIDGECDDGACLCASDPPNEVSCNDGICGACPNACPYECTLECACFIDGCGCPQPFCTSTQSCEVQAERMQEAAADIARCQVDDDCTVMGSPICPELGCYMFVNVNAIGGDGVNEHLANLVSDYVANNCVFGECACSPPPDEELVQCIDGVCTIPPP